VIDGFRLFGDPSVCELLHSAIYLSADGELLARRRYCRQCGCYDGNEPEWLDFRVARLQEEWRDFREEYVEHIYAHHLQAEPGMLANVESILCGTIAITADKTVDAVVAEAQQLLLSGVRGANTTVGSKRAASDSGAVSASPTAASASPTAYASPVPTRPAPYTPPPRTPPPQLSPPPASTSATAAPATPESTLAALPVGSTVAVLDFLGSLCPITTCHVRCLGEARRILTGELPPVNADGALKPYAACLGAIWVNGETYVRSKFMRSGEEALCERDRLELCRLATASDASWIRVGTPADTWVTQLRTMFPSLQFTVWMLNGADDVVRFEKWEWASPDHPFITMGRVGDTPTILEAIGREGLTSDAFVLGPDLPEVSSTAARKALRQADDATVEACLHPDVAAWLKHHGPYRPE